MLREIRELLAYHAWGTERFARHDVENVYRKTLRDLEPFGFGDVAGKRVLDLGCGQRMPFALQCAAAGAARWWRWTWTMPEEKSCRSLSSAP